VNPGAIGVVDGTKGRLVAEPQAFDQRDFEIPLHVVNNARHGPA